MSVVGISSREIYAFSNTRRRHEKDSERRILDAALTLTRFAMLSRQRAAASPKRGGYLQVDTHLNTQRDARGEQEAQGLDAQHYAHNIL